jgi:hypothetical protein
METNPAETILDVSTVMTGGSTADSKLGIPGAQAAAQIANVPAMAQRGVRVANTKLRPDRGQKLWDSAIKPGTTIPQAERARMRETSHREGLRQTQEGMDKLRDIKTSLNGTLDRMINEAELTGRTFTVQELAGEVRKLHHDWNNSPAPGASQNAAKLRNYMNSWLHQLDL